VVSKIQSLEIKEQNNRPHRNLAQEDEGDEELV